MTGDAWAGRLRLAALRGVPPEAFWRLSLPEWRVLTAAPAAPAPMGRVDFAALAAAHPDTPEAA